jgi:predicted RNA-binding protein YlxR (DUF448 family)
MGEPERQCIGCGRRGPRRTFLRLAVMGEAPAARVAVVDRGPHKGRGAYLCRRQACLDRALLRKAFQRAFRTTLVVEREELAAALGNGDGEEPDRSNGG